MGESRSMAQKAMIRHPYITRKKAKCGGQPTIVGTRIKVAQIVVEYDRMGWTPDEIVQAHPHLSLPQIHDALSYYYENAEEMNESIRAGEQLVEHLQKVYPSSVFEKKHGRVENLHK